MAALNTWWKGRLLEKVNLTYLFLKDNSWQIFLKKLNDVSSNPIMKVICQLARTRVTSSEPSYAQAYIF